MTKEQKRQFRWYHLLFAIAWPIVKIFYPHKVYGVENIPEGPCIICPLHSNLPDPFYVSIALGWNTFCHHMAKYETRKIPVLGWIMEKMGSIFVHRREQDIDSYKASVRALQAGEKLMIFPEGTRVHGDDYVPAKTGVIRMAATTHAPIVPVYMPRDKKLFRSFDLVFGEPYYIEKAGKKDYERLAQELLDKAWALKERAHG